ncbi:hypothetical protein GE061_017743 [Apolygus lucorum]|uniref:Uncharacterized protein n=1 Tax=Apolygus lucorum TaxID=248454 RepID=A0A8S9XBR4_APOLU|nr:hypothetical protein GE061_017743 [Apolygus lucorum]
MANGVAERFVFELYSIKISHLSIELVKSPLKIQNEQLFKHFEKFEPQGIPNVRCFEIFSHKKNCKRGYNFSFFIFLISLIHSDLAIK